MRKIIIVLLILILGGCSSCSLFDKDCDDTLDVTKYIELGYKQETAQKIVSLSDDTKELFNEYNNDFERIINTDNFKEEFLTDYLNCLVDIDTYIYAISNNIVINDLFLKFYNDKYFIINNLDLYRKYESDFNDTRALIEYVNTKAYKIPYEEYENSDLTMGNLIIASKLYYLDNYVPEDLIEVEDGYYLLSKPTMTKEAYEAFKDMADNARKEDIYFYISTAYRSYDFQNALYNKYLLIDTKEEVDTYSSRPGFSDHQIGLSCDIRTYDLAFDEFTGTKEDIWLKENAYKYGFIQRYPENKENITGYIAESWHYRYVGKDVAKTIYEDKITFDEYYAYFNKEL